MQDEVRTVTSMPDNALENIAPCSAENLSTYWHTSRPVNPSWCDPSAEPNLSIPVNFGTSSTSQPAPPNAVVGSVLPLRRAQELIATLPGVLAVRIVPSDTGAIDEVHILATMEVAPKNMVRNIESALMAQLGLRINHRKVSISPTLDPVRAADLPSAPPATPPYSHPAQQLAGGIPGVASPAYVPAQPAVEAQAASAPIVTSATQTPTPTSASGTNMAGPATVPAPSTETQGVGRRVLIFEDVEVRRSRTRGVVCRVTLSKDGTEYHGESEGQESERSRIELAARSTVLAILEAMKATPGSDRVLALEGAKLIDAFDRDFVFASVVARVGRESATLTGTCAVHESKEIAAVLAVLDATNRWMQLDR